MSWAVLAVLTACFESAKDVLGKRALSTLDPVVAAWGWHLLTLPFLLLFLAATGVPALGPDFGWALVAGGGLNVVSSVLYMRAIRESDLSLVVPLIAFTPLFLLFTSPLLLGEFPRPKGIAGVILIVLGSYSMMSRERSGLAPFRALLREPGARWMLLVALIWSLTANVDKIGVGHSSPAFWAVAINLFISMALAPAALRRKGALARPTFRTLFPLGAAGGLGIICQMTAITLTIVPYVIAIKRTSTVMSVLWGHFLFGEQGLRERLRGASLMLIGMVLVLIP